MRFDHAIIAVTDLEVATADFKTLGFAVHFGGKHSGGLTHNALVTFADASYIELVAPTDPELLKNPPPPGPGNYLFLFDRGEGYAGYVFHTDDLDRVVERARISGIAINDPTSGGRHREDGVELTWRTAFPPDSTFPFFMTDETPRENRVRTDAEVVSHLNGAESIVRAVSVVADFDQGISRYSSLLGADPIEGPRIEGAKTASFMVGEFEAVIASPRESANSLIEHLDARGESLYQIEIRSSKHAAVVSHGARIVFVGV
jgi:hypothetical protein